jgi:hypothetical protein
MKAVIFAGGVVCLVPQFACFDCHFALQLLGRTLVTRRAHSFDTAFCRRLCDDNFRCATMPRAPRAHLLKTGRWGCCGICGTFLGSVYEVDHKLPIVSAQSSRDKKAVLSAGNVRCLCLPCHRAKSATERKPAPVTLCKLASA